MADLSCSPTLSEGGTMVAAWKVYWSIFWRTFTVLSASILIGAQGWDWVSDGATVANASNLGWLELGATIAALAAALWAYSRTPAVTPIGKATRAAVEALLGSVIFTATITNASDAIALEHLIVPALIGIALAFVITYFNNQGGVPQPTDMTLDTRVFYPFNNVT